MDSASSDTSLITLTLISTVSEEQGKLTHQPQSHPVSLESIKKVKTMALKWGDHERSKL
jgi:hypothetical protein